MDRKIFEAICEAIIRPLGEDLAARTFLEDQEGKDVLTFSGEWDSALHERYESWRSHAHSVMREEEMLIDRHKIVACLMLAILEDGPLQLTQVNPDGRFQPIVRICNEVLAFQAGMLVLTRSFSVSSVSRHCPTIPSNSASGMAATFCEWLDNL